MACAAQKISRNSGWTPERRARQAARIKIWAPWAKSTGPKTIAGKRKSSRNARKSASGDRAIKAVWRHYGRYLVDIDLYIRLKKNAAQNELLKGPLYNLKRRLLRRGKTLTQALSCALIYDAAYSLRKTTPEWIGAKPVLV